MNEGEEPPRPKFPYLKKGTGTRKYNNVSYITKRQSMDPQGSSIPDDGGSTNRNGTPLSSGHGSRATSSTPINKSPDDYAYAVPNTGRPDSGYGEQHRTPSPDQHEPFRRSRFEQTVASILSDVGPLEQTFASTNPPSTSNHTPTVVCDVDESVGRLPTQQSQARSISSASDFSDDHTNAGIPSIQNDDHLPARAGGYNSDRSEYSAATRAQADKAKFYSSQVVTDPSLTSDSDVSTHQQIYLTSTPKKTFPGSRSVVESQPKSIRFGAETGILNPTFERTGSQSLSSDDSNDIVKPTFLFDAPSEAQAQPRSASDGESTIAARELIAPRDRPLHEAFPSTSFSQPPPVETVHKPPKPPVVQASQSTRYPAIPETDRLRRLALQNDISRKVHVIPSSAESSTTDEVTPTPRLPRRTKVAQEARRREAPTIATADVTNDIVVQELRRQLATEIAHLDLAHATLVSKFDERQSDLDRRFRELDEDRRKFEREKENKLLEIEDMKTNLLQQRQALKKDRDALMKREQDAMRNEESAEKENRARVVAISSKAAEHRLKVTKKDEEIKRLEAELAKANEKAQRMEKTINLMRTNNQKEIKAKDARINELEKQISSNAPKKVVGLVPRNKMPPRFGDAQHANREHAPAPSEPFLSPNRSGLRHDSTSTDDSALSRRQVRFAAEPPSEFTLSPNTSLPSNTLRLRNTMQTDMGVCQEYEDTKGEFAVNVYKIRHVSGHVCGASVYKFHNNNVKWMFGPAQVYYYSLFPLVVSFLPLDLSIVVFTKSLEIRRSNGEVSHFDFSTGILTEMLTTRNGKRKYFVRFYYDGTEKCKILGQSDKPEEQDRMALRRGTVANPSEFVKFTRSTRSSGNIADFTSSELRTSVVKWIVHAESGTCPVVKVAFELHDKHIIDICTYPSEDWVYIRHVNKESGSKEPCCDMGRDTRRRERDGEFIASGTPIKLPYASSSNASFAQ